MEPFDAYIQNIEDIQHKARMEEILQWVGDHFPMLEKKIAWNQPMFTDHETFIIGFSISKQHIAISPEYKGMEQFREEIKSAGYAQTKMLFHIKWAEEVKYDLLHTIIVYNREDKRDCTTFWRK